MADRNYTFRQIAKALTQDDSNGIVTGRARRVDRISKRAYCTTLGSKAGAWFGIQTQELADRLAARIAAGETPSVRIRDDIVIDDMSANSGGARGNGTGVIVPSPGNQSGVNLQAPQWREVDPLVVGVRSIAVAWIPIFNANVIGYRVKLVAPDGIVSFYSFSADEYEVEIGDITHGHYAVQVQGIAAGGVAGDFNGLLSADVLADVTPPAKPKDIVHSWSNADRKLDLFFRWSAPGTLPSDFAGYDVEIRNAATGYTKRRITIDGNVAEAYYRFADNQADVGSASPSLVIAIRSRDVWGNASAWVEATANFPAVADPKTPAHLTTIFKQVNVSLDAAPAFIEQQEIFISPGDQIIRLVAGTSNANFFGATGTTYTVSYRYIDAFGRATAYSPPSSIMVARNEIGFDDLGALEQITVKSSKTRTAAELGALIDNKLLDQAFTTQVGEVISFEYPIATRIAGIVLYGPSAVSPTFYLSYDKLDGSVLELGGNVDSDTTNGTLNNMIMREFASGTNGRPIAATLGAVGGYFMAEWRFGDATVDPATRKFKAIATRKLRVIFNNAVAISEIRILTYEAANTFVGRRMYLNEGLQIESDDSSTGFQITSAGIKGYNNGVEQVSISAVDGALRAAGGKIRMDANDYISLYDDDNALVGTIGYDSAGSSSGIIPIDQYALAIRSSGMNGSVVYAADDFVGIGSGGTYAKVFGVTFAVGPAPDMTGSSFLLVDPSKIELRRPVRVTQGLRVVSGGMDYNIYGFVPLTTPTVIWDGSTAKAIGGYEIPLTSYGLPSGVKAALVQFSGTWPTSSNNNYASLRPGSGTVNVAVMRALVANINADMTVVVPCVNGQIDAYVNGAALNNAVLRIWGYYL